MLFDEEKINNFIGDKKKIKKISEAVLKYIIVKNEFDKDICLYENAMFRKYFTDLYVLNTGAWKSAVSQEIFYRLFESIKENYRGKFKSIESETCVLKDIYKEIFILLSHISGWNERSFSSKILHTLCDNSPIIDSNVLTGLSINISKEDESIDSEQALKIYNELSGRYYSKNDFNIPPKRGKRYSGKGFIYYLNQDFYKKFNNVCLDYINQNFDSVKCIFDDIKKSFNISDEKELKVEIEKSIKGISEVKKIDFYLWALFAK